MKSFTDNISSIMNLLTLIFLIFTSNVFTATKENQNNTINIKLTPLGAIKAGNASSIPEWKNGEQELNSEKLFIIDKNNYKNYLENLTEGQIAMLENYGDSFNMPVYASQRTAIAPQWVYDNTQHNSNNARLNSDKSGFENAKAGIPFPQPKSALEIYFNHVARWRGLQLKNTASDAVVYKNGNYTLTTRESIIRYDGYIENSSSKYFISVLAKTIAPATKSGSGVLVLEPLDQLNDKRASWLWDKGRRRVIRAPQIAYDNPVQSSGSLRTVDDTDMISGSPDRFDWEIVGKKEIFVPYNNERLDDKDLKYGEILHAKHINPEYTRYELHRVWVIRATLKPEWRHIYSKREFYIDEDSWQVLIADQYDKKGELWRVSMSYPKFYKEIPGIFHVINVFHDLTNQQYHVMGLQNELESKNEFNGKIVKDNMFTPNGFKMYMK